MYKEIVGSATPWTGMQKLAIGLTGGSVLVSASAGSGKTAVLTERIVQRVIDREDRAGVRDFVVVTFTKAAAAEMRSRLAKKLGDYLRDNRDDAHVKSQLMYIPEANISTIDAFCLSLLEKYQSAAGADYSADVRIATKAEAEMLFRKALEEALEDEFKTGDADFYALVDAMEDNSGGNSKLKDSVCDLHGLLSRMPDRRAFSARLKATFAGGYNASNKALFADAFANVSSGAQFHLKRLRELLAETPEVPAGDAKREGRVSKQTSYFNLYADHFTALREAAESEDYGACVELFGQKLKDKPQTLKKDYPEYAEWMQKRDNVISACVSFRKSAAELFAATDEELRADAGLLATVVGRLFALTELAEAKYAALKKERGVWDYADLEGKALGLLYERGEDGSFLRDGDGNFVRTAISKEEGASHKEILVDEYQDVNGMQEMIFAGICSEKNDNLFMVGDVKQAIYGFRGAEPELFMRRRREYLPATAEDAEFPAKIALNNNFRSRKSVTDAINAVFTAVMTDETCGINYGADDALYPDPAAENENPCSGAYFTLLQRDNAEDGRRREGGYVAAKIKEILASGMKVFNKRDGTERDVGYGDIVVLMRSTTQPHLRPFAEALEEAGIPFCAPDTVECLGVPSVKKMISLLRSVDNPMKDIDLAAAMMSGIFGFTESEAVGVRRRAGGVFYYAVKAAADAGDEKCADFLAKLEHLRRRAAVLTADKLIWYIYKTYGFLAFASALKNGAHERAALMRFYEIAKEYGASGRQDLSGFIAHVDRMIAEDVKSGGKGVPGVGGEVRIMSIHASKGLEFPVCFICDAASPYNEKELSNGCIIGDGGVFGIKIAEPRRHLTRDTAARKLAAQKLKRRMREEEIRLLYVAMTRAIERLEIVASVNDVEKTKEDSVLRLDAAGRAPAFETLGANCYLKLVAPTALAGLGGFNVSIDPEIGIVSADEEEREIPEPDADAVERIFERINGEYAYPDSVSVPTKLTVSDIVAMKAGRGGEDHCCERRPACLDAERRSGAEAGTATHAFLQFADFAKLGDPEAELERLVAQRFMTERQAKLVDRRKIANFVSSDVFKRIIAAKEVVREYRFTFESDASDYVAGAPAERLLVQGAIDCLFEEEGRWIVVDYKTDRISDNIDEKIAYYRPQLEIYARGLREMTGREVSEAFLFFLDTGEAVRVI